MNTILIYAGAIFLSILLVLSIDGIIIWISREQDEEFLGLFIAIMNGILAACLISILLISKVG